MNMQTVSGEKRDNAVIQNEKFDISITKYLRIVLNYVTENCQRTSIEPLTFNSYQIMTQSIFTFIFPYYIHPTTRVAAIGLPMFKDPLYLHQEASIIHYFN